MDQTHQADKEGPSIDPPRPTHAGISLASDGRHSSQIESVQCQLVRTVCSIQRTKTWETEGDGIFYVKIVWILIDVIALSTFISFLPTLCERWHRVRGRRTHTNEAKCLRDWRPTHPSRTRVGKQIYKCGKTVMTGESHCGFHCITLSTFLHT